MKSAAGYCAQDVRTDCANQAEPAMTDESQPNTPEDHQPEAEDATSEPEMADATDAPVDPAAETSDAGASFSADDAAAMAESLLAQVSAAVSDVNAGETGDASGDSSEPATAAPPPQSAPVADPPPGSEPMDLPSFDAPIAPEMPAELDLLADVNLNVKIELGRTRLLVDDVLKLNEGAVVELDKLAGDPVDIYVNDRHVARGEVLVLNDNFCVRINEIVEPENRQVG